MAAVEGQARHRLEVVAALETLTSLDLSCLNVVELLWADFTRRMTGVYLGYTGSSPPTYLI